MNEEIIPRKRRNAVDANFVGSSLIRTVEAIIKKDIETEEKAGFVWNVDADAEAKVLDRKSKLGVKYALKDMKKAQIEVSKQEHDRIKFEEKCISTLDKKSRNKKKKVELPYSERTSVQLKTFVQLKKNAMASYAVT